MSTDDFGVAGADLSLAKTGLALGDGTLLTITPGRLGGYRRLRPMAQAVLQRLHHHGLVILEGYDPHPRGYLALVRAAELGGIVRAGLLELDIRFLDCPPGTLKKFATGKGNASKDDVFKAANLAILGTTQPAPTNDDEADAYWLRRIGIELEADPANPVETLAKLAEDLASPLPPRV